MRNIKMVNIILPLFLTWVILVSGQDIDDSEFIGQNKHFGSRNGKLLNMFTVVRFTNAPCIGTGNRNGTCYTSTECSQRGGSSSGTCASGYGVCCTFIATCGQTFNENCTYFESTGNEGAGQCRLIICPCGSDICQLRLDFNTFTISGPSTVSDSVATTLNGQVTAAAGKAVANRGRCLTDTFSVTNPGGLTPPTICGINTGEHMYVDSASDCNELAFQLGNAAVGLNAVATRAWNIKVTQYSCSFNNLAPDGCTQYFFGAQTQFVQTFNYNGGAGEHLSDQNQNICVRRERSFCRICWTTMNAIDFAVSGPAQAAAGAVTDGSMCCGYGNNGLGISGFDCAIIPGAEKTGMTAVKNSAFCGRKGLGTTNVPVTVCSRATPFQLRFISDTFEFGDNDAAIDDMEEATAPDRGFQLLYNLVAC